MYLEPNNAIRQSTSFTDIPAGNQLVPYYPGQNQVIPYPAESSRMLTLSKEPGSKRYSQWPPPFHSEKKNQPDPFESAYNSRRLLVTSKINQVGLLIDIYA